MMNLRTTLLLLVAMMPFSVSAMNVLTSIKPIQMITHELTMGISTPDVLLGSNTSPHDYALKPSDVKRIRDADLVIWFGRDLEPFLEKVITGNEQVLQLNKNPNLILREYEGAAHQHEGHDHGNHDPHFWLGSKQVKEVAKSITKKLIEVDAINSDKYQTNLAKFTEQLNKKVNHIDQQLSPVKNKGYFVFHDAYGYFEIEFELNNIGHFTVSPDRKPGAKTLIHIRKSLANAQAKCVFSEPQFTPTVIESVTRGSDVKIGVLDPIGIDVSVEDGSYFVFLQQMADDFTNCLVD